MGGTMHRTPFYQVTDIIAVLWEKKNAFRLFLVHGGIVGVEPAQKGIAMNIGLGNLGFRPGIDSGEVGGVHE